MVSTAHIHHVAGLAGLAGLRRQLDGTPNDSSALLAGSVSLPADVVETPDELRFTIEVPGMSAHDIELTVEDGVLTVTGERKAPAVAEPGASYRLAERRYGRFARRFRLPRTAAAARIQASCEDGLLVIRVPREEATRARRIEVHATAPVGQAAGDAASA